MKVYSFDLETYLIQPGLLTPKPVCGAWWTDEGTGGLKLWSDFLPDLEAALDTDCLLVGANIAYDFGVVCAHVPRLVRKVFQAYEDGRVWDIQIAQALMDIGEGHLFKNKDGSPIKVIKTDGSKPTQASRYSLETCVWLLLGRNDAKGNSQYRMKYHTLDNKPIETWPEAASKYPVDDARNTYECYAKQVELGSPNFGPVQNKTWTHVTHQTRAAWAMHLSSAWGLRVDPVAVQKLEVEYGRRAKAGTETLKKLGFLKEDGSKDLIAIKRAVVFANGGSPDLKCTECAGKGRVKGASKAGKNCPTCFGTGLELNNEIPRTETGGIATDRDTLAESDSPELDQYATVAKDFKILETYLPFLQSGVKARINVRPNVLVETGRASYDGLVQLIPRDGGVRECFVPSPGYVFCSVDYAALELCTLAQVTTWLCERSGSKMAEVINESKDPGALHTVFAAKMLDRDVDEFKALVKAGDKAAKNTRQMAKAANFGFPGGMGPAKLVLAKRKEGLRFCTASGIKEVCGEEMTPGIDGGPRVCTACLSIATRLRKQYLLTWEEIREYLNLVAGLPGINANEGVWVSPGTGYVRGGLGFSNGANHPFQHLAAMGAKHALWQISRECYTDRSSPLFGSRPVLFAHDEIIAELPEAKAHEAANRMAEIMIASMREFVPDVHIAAEPALMRYWTKAAEPKFDANGRLVPWEK